MTDVAKVQWNDDVAGVYRQRTPESARFFAEAATLFPSGITHDGRHIDPYPIYVGRAQGPPFPGG